jgi:hypothetical protein
MEVKGKKKVTTHDQKGLHTLKEEGMFRSYIVVSLEDIPRVADCGIHIKHWKEFLEELWQDVYV